MNIRLAILFFFFLAALSGCGKKKQPEKANSNQSVTTYQFTDKNLLFDGNSLIGWEITEYGTQGPVSVSDGKIILEYGDGCTGINWKGDFPVMNYEVTLEAQKTTGNDFFCGITFPVNDQFCSLIVGGWGGPVVGLSCIDGNDAAHNETKILKRFDKNVWYKIRLKVDNEKIIAWIDDEKMVDFAYQGRRLSLRAEVELSKPFGLITWETTGEIKNIRLIRN